VKIGRSPSFSNRQNGSTVVPRPKTKRDLLARAASEKVNPICNHVTRDPPAHTRAERSRRRPGRGVSTPGPPTSARSSPLSLSRVSRLVTDGPTRAARARALPHRGHAHAHVHAHVARPLLNLTTATRLHTSIVRCISSCAQAARLTSRQSPEASRIGAFVLFISGSPGGGGPCNSSRCMPHVRLTSAPSGTR
jgi:hypothetical protein